MDSFRSQGEPEENARSKKEETKHMAWEANISVQFLSIRLQKNRQEAYEEIKVTLKIESPKNHALQSIPDALNQNDYLQSQDHGILK